MKEHLDIGILISQCLAFFEENAYSDSQICVYRRLWKQGVIAYMNKRSVTEYTLTLSAEFRRACYRADVGRRHEAGLLRSVTVLDDMLTTGKVSLRNAYRSSYPLPGAIGAMMEPYLTQVRSRRLSQATVRTHRRHLHYFLNWLYFNGVDEVGAITEEHVAQFVGTYKCPGRQSVLSTLRQLFRFWNESGLYTGDISDILSSFTVPSREKIPSYYSREEVMRIEASVNRACATGKRDYAMTLLASRLGMRASDIAGLRFDDIDWDGNRIMLIMQKTGKSIELPLLPDVGNALIDYLRYGRRKNPCRNLFLSAVPPYRPATSDIVRHAIEKAISGSGVETNGRHHGSHSLRHSLASAMLENGVRLPCISESLGHTYTTSTMRYLRIDLNSLMACALAVPAVSDEFYTQRGGLFYE